MKYLDEKGSGGEAEKGGGGEGIKSRWRRRRRKRRRWRRSRKGRRGSREDKYLNCGEEDTIIKGRRQTWRKGQGREELLQHPVRSKKTTHVFSFSLFSGYVSILQSIVLPQAAAGCPRVCTHKHHASHNTATISGKPLCSLHQLSRTVELCIENLMFSLFGGWEFTCRCGSHQTSEYLNLTDCSICLTAATLVVVVVSGGADQMLLLWFWRW